MRYVFGIDGGGSKTACLIAKEDGQVVGSGQGGPANYQTSSIEVTQASIEQALNQALEEAGLDLQAMSYGVLGLAGADSPMDYEVLNPLCQKVLGPIPHEVVNDTWIGLASGAPNGVVSICGTGAAHASKHPSGQEAILRNLDYSQGNRGGGGEILEQAIHFAFRSQEGTYHKTAIEAIVLDVFGLKDYDALSDYLRCHDMPAKVSYELPIRVFEAASEGDRVAMELVQDMGYTEGLYAAAVAKKAGYEQGQALTCVLIGSVFQSRHPLLLEAYKQGVSEHFSQVSLVIPDRSPVEGAISMGIEALKNK